MTDGIHIRVLGDFGPFSTMGKSIGYQVTIAERSFLVDCGAPLFQQIGGHGLKVVSGLIITHGHDDHKRWFSDLALFNLYAPDISHKVPLFTSERVEQDLRIASGPALESSLSGDSQRVIDLAYDDYVDFRPLGPRPRYRIVNHARRPGSSDLAVVDRDGNPLGPERAKIVVSATNGKPRLLFFDPDYQEWVEPETFYPFSSAVFYESEQNVYRDPAGFTIEALNAPVWHGVPSIGLRFRTARESLVFSADTVHDLRLWQTLAEEKRPQRLAVTPAEFAAASVLVGDINDYVERIWSRERYADAVAAFGDSIVIHDVSSRRSVVHTDYPSLEHTVLQREKTLLTHSPDKFTSTWALSRADKHFVVSGSQVYEEVNDQRWPLDAAVYHKEGGKYYVGFACTDGEETIYRKDGMLNLGGPYHYEKGELLFRADLFEDVAGRYLPRLRDPACHYQLRGDGQVELVTETTTGSHGVIVADQRPALCRCVSPQLD